MAETIGSGWRARFPARYLPPQPPLSRLARTPQDGFVLLLAWLPANWRSGSQKLFPSGFVPAEARDRWVSRARFRRLAALRLAPNSHKQPTPLRAAGTVRPAAPYPGRHPAGPEAFPGFAAKRGRYCQPGA